MKIEIIKQFRLLEVGKQLDADREWASNLIKRGFAKSLEVVEDIEKSEEVEEIQLAKKIKKEK